MPRSGRRPGPAGRRRARARLAGHSASREPRGRTRAAARRARARTRAGTRSDRPTTWPRPRPCRPAGAAAAELGRPDPRTHQPVDHAWSSRMLPSGSVRYVHVTRRPSDVPVVTISPITPPPSASTASRAAATSGHRERDVPEAGPVDRRRRPLGPRTVLEDLERRAVVAEARQAEMRAADRGARHAGPGLENRAAEITLGRHEDAAEDALVEVGEQPPVGGDEIDVSESRLDHDGPSSRRPRTQAPRTMSGWGRKISRLTRAEGSSSRAGSSGAAPRNGDVIAGSTTIRSASLPASSEPITSERPSARAPSIVPRRSQSSGAERRPRLAGDRSQPHLRERPDPHHAEERRIRSARHVRPEPDGDPSLEPAGQRHHARPR